MKGKVLNRDEEILFANVEPVLHTRLWEVGRTTLLCSDRNWAKQSAFDKQLYMLESLKTF